LPDTVKQLIELANRPLIAGMVLYDPLLKNVSVQGLASLGQVPVELLEQAFSQAIDRLKSYKAEQTLKAQAEQKTPEPPTTE
jgi:hypothetical protein